MHPSRRLAQSRLRHLLDGAGLCGVGPDQRVRADLPRRSSISARSPPRCSSPCPSCSARSRACRSGMLTDRFGGRAGLHASCSLFVAVAACARPERGDLRAAARRTASCSASRAPRSRSASASRRAGSRPSSRARRSASTASATWATRRPCSSGRVVAARYGRDAVFYTVAALSAVWAVLFFAARAQRARSPCARRRSPR